MPTWQDLDRFADDDWCSRRVALMDACELARHTLCNKYGLGPDDANAPSFNQLVRQFQKDHPGSLPDRLSERARAAWDDRNQCVHHFGQVAPHLCKRHLGTLQLLYEAVVRTTNVRILKATEPYPPREASGALGRSQRVIRELEQRIADIAKENATLREAAGVQRALAQLGEAQVRSIARKTYARLAIEPSRARWRLLLVGFGSMAASVPIATFGALSNAAAWGGAVALVAVAVASFAIRRRAGQHLYAAPTEETYDHWFHADLLPAVRAKHPFPLALALPDAARKGTLREWREAVAHEAAVLWLARAGTVDRQIVSTCSGAAAIASAITMTIVIACGLVVAPGMEWPIHLAFGVISAGWFAATVYATWIAIDWSSSTWATEQYAMRVLGGSPWLAPPSWIRALEISFLRFPLALVGYPLLVGCAFFTVAGLEVGFGVAGLAFVLPLLIRRMRPSVDSSEHRRTMAAPGLALLGASLTIAARCALYSHRDAISSGFVRAAIVGNRILALNRDTAVFMLLFGGAFVWLATRLTEPSRSLAVAVQYLGWGTLVLGAAILFLQALGVDLYVSPRTFCGGE